MPGYFNLSFEELLWMLTPLVILVITVVSGYILRNFLLSRLNRLAAKTKTEIDDLFISSIRNPFIIWFVILGVYFALKASELPVGATSIINRVLIVIGIFSVTLMVANIISRLIKVYAGKIETALPVTSLTQIIARIVIFTVGLLVILNTLGISITPILATLGIGGLAVALALQDTFSNIFSGFYLVIAKQIRPGDYIKLDSGEEGYVIDINWRTTQIRMLSNNMILVPNEKITKVIVTNFYLPNKELAVLVNLGVHHKSDLKLVEKITSEVAGEVMKSVPGGVPEFEPFIRYNAFSDSAINFTVILRAKEFVDQYLIKHEFIKQLHERYRKEGILIPYPIRAINYEQEKH